MIKYIFVCILVLVFLSEGYAVRIENPDTLLAKREYFQLRRFVNRKSPQPDKFSALYYQAYLDNFFNNKELSNRAIQSLLKDYSEQLTKARKASLIKLQIDNMIKLYRYREAWINMQQLLKEYGDVISAEEKKETENEQLIWKALAGQDRQQLDLKRDEQIPFVRDIAGLINIQVKAGNDSTSQFVFDTGANISVVSQTNAAKLDIKALGDPFKVTAITGIEIEARAGVCSVLRIGQILVKNAVFMIFPDSALQFGNGSYSISGIIGFPVIDQLGQIELNKAGYLKVSAHPQSKSLHNFGLDGLIPIVEFSNGTDLLDYTFDTGAQESFLNQPYFKKYQTSITRQSPKTELRFGGAGGQKTIDSYIIPSITLSTSGASAVLNNIHIKTVSTEEKDQYYYGNIGQDLIRNFSSVIINFKNMYIEMVK